MYKNFLFLILVNIICINISANANYLEFSPSQFSNQNEIVVEKWNSDEGIKRLQQSKYKNDFYQLANFFQPQINPLYCGIASSVIILNAIRSEKNQIKSQKELEITKPDIFGGGSAPFKSYSQITFLNKKTDKIKDQKIIELKNLSDDKSNIDPGLSLNHLAKILQKSYDLNVKINHVSKIRDKDINNFRNTIQKILNDKEKYILANFQGKTVGLKVSGHISPIVAYDQISDSILVMDVAGHKNPWYWIKLEHFYKAMNTKDGKQYRGYITIWN